MSKLVEFVSRNAHLIGRKIYENRSEICLGLGLTSMVASTVVVGVQATKLPDRVAPLHDELKECEKIMNEAIKKMDDTENPMNDIRYDVIETAKQRKFKIYKRYFLEIAKLFGVGIALQLFGGFLVLYSHKVKCDEVESAMAFVNMMEGTFMAYRAKVAEEIGEDREQEIYSGISTKTEDIYNPETGENYQELVKTFGRGYGPWAFEFARGKSELFCDEFDYNVSTCRGREIYLSQQLRMKGIITMVDVWDAYGVLSTRTKEEIKAGTEWGWVYKGDEPVGSVFIDVGIKEYMGIPYPSADSVLHHSIPLNPNVMGRIKDLL